MAHLIKQGWIYGIDREYIFCKLNKRDDPDDLLIFPISHLLPEHIDVMDIGMRVQYDTENGTLQFYYSDKVTLTGKSEQFIPHQ